MAINRRAFSRMLAGAVPAVLGGTATCSFSQSADAYPSKPIRIIVPVAAGGSTDVITRIIGERLGARLGQPIVVENRPGAGGMVGAEFVAAAPPDGYTLMMAYASFALSPHLFKSARYDPRAFVPISQAVTQPICIVVNPAFGPKTMKELIAYAKAHPGKVSVGIATSGSSGHVAFEQLKMMTGVEATPIIYKSAAPNMTALLANEVPVSFSSVSAALPMESAGRLRIIATLTPRRLKQTPGVPTAAEEGVNLLAAGWSGLVAPPRTPQAIAEKIYANLAEILRQQETIDKLATVGADVVASSPAEFAGEIDREWNEFKAVVEKSGMKPG